MAHYSPPPLPGLFTHVSPKPTVVAQGAEAHLYKTVFLDASTPAALKIRRSKPYRHPTLDRRLTKQRILQEARCLVKLVREGVSVPAVLAMDWEGEAAPATEQAAAKGAPWLLMEWIDGTVIRVVLEQWERSMKMLDSNDDIAREEDRIRKLMYEIGRTIGDLHNAGVIHGDLTTSNLMLKRACPSPEADVLAEHAAVAPSSMEGEIVLIDFGLASQSTQDEDRAVDLYVLERAFGSSHPRTEPFFDQVLRGYRERYSGAVSALRRLEDVRLRGRKRSMIG